MPENTRGHRIIHNIVNMAAAKNIQGKLQVLNAHQVIIEPRIPMGQAVEPILAMGIRVEAFLAKF